MISLSIHDASLLQKAVELGNADFADEIADGLITLFSNAGCRETPNAKNLERLIIQSARYTFLVKPAAALMNLNNGFPRNIPHFGETFPLKS